METALGIFAARSASIAVLDHATGEFVFAAVAGESERDLVGSRFAAGEGIAGAAVADRQINVVDDLDDDPRFARDIAVETGYVPDAMLVAPLLHGDDVRGVLWVLDPRRPGMHPERELDLLRRFADQAALTLVFADAAIGAAAPGRSGSRPPAP